MSKTFEAVKDPDEVKDYGIDWALLLAGDTISGSTWAIADGTGLVIDSDSHGLATTTVWLSSGAAGTTYQLRNSVTTAGGRTYDQTVKLKAKSK